MSDIEQPARDWRIPHGYRVNLGGTIPQRCWGDPALPYQIEYRDQDLRLVKFRRTHYLVPGQEIAEWCRDQCLQHWRMMVEAFAFELERDAAAFRLRWG